jgi:hypothetical protein
MSDYKFEDFYSYTVGGRCIYRPRRMFCSNEAVDRCLGPQSLVRNGALVKNTKGKVATIPASIALAEQRNVMAVVWSPADPEVVLDKLAFDSGWVTHLGAKTYNMCRPSDVALGDATQATPWVAHWHALYPGDADHIIGWLAHRVQFPGDKQNHGLVLVGDPGIGKDTLLHPVTYAIGPWNYRDISLNHLVSPYNDYLAAVLLRINEARDAGDSHHGRIDRYALHDHMKHILASPPETIRINRKYDPQYPCFNVVGVVITSNHIDALYLTADDRRHHVARSERRRADFPKAFFDDFYRWYADGGVGHVAAYLRAYPLAQSGFDAKASPPQTAAFKEMVSFDRGIEYGELADAIDALGRPEALTLAELAAKAPGVEWLTDRKQSRAVPHRLQRCGYIRTPNMECEDQQWVIKGKRQMIYTRADLPPDQRVAAAKRLRGPQLSVVPQAPPPPSPSRPEHAETGARSTNSGEIGET